MIVNPAPSHTGISDEPLPVVQIPVVSVAPVDVLPDAAVPAVVVAALPELEFDEDVEVEPAALLPAVVSAMIAAPAPGSPVHQTPPEPPQLLEDFWAQLVALPLRSPCAHVWASVDFHVGRLQQVAAVRVGGVEGGAGSPPTASHQTPFAPPQFLADVWAHAPLRLPRAHVCALVDFPFPLSQYGLQQVAAVRTEGMEGGAGAPPHQTPSVLLQLLADCWPHKILGSPFAHVSTLVDFAPPAL